MENLKKFVDNTNEWDLYNGFFLNEDVERLRKFLVRENFFRMSLELPGNIVEIGVFKGTGIAQLLKLREIFIPASNKKVIAQLLKLREIFIPASNKKVIGFDLFSESNNYKETLTNNNLKLDEYYTNSGINMDDGISTDDISEFINKMKLTNTRMGFNTDIYQLIEGDVEKTIPVYLEKNPGFRISYLYLDLDIDKPTYASLNMLYDRIVRGGIIVFDEYACEKWSESNAEDRFLNEHPNLNIKTLLWGKNTYSIYNKKLSRCFKCPKL